MLNAEQSRLFLEAALKTHFGPVLAFALTTATRPSEYLGLRWQDINWEGETVAVVRTLVRSDGNWHFADTKRTRSRRVIKLQTWVLELLKSLRAKGKTNPRCSCPPDMEELIFTTPSGQPIPLGQARKEVQVNPGASRLASDPALRSPAHGRNTRFSGRCSAEGGI